jgi:Flp pilus assembly secretin CpaC
MGDTLSVINTNGLVIINPATEYRVSSLSLLSVVALANETSIVPGSHALIKARFETLNTTY